MKVVGVSLHDLHGLKLFEPCFLRDLVFAFVSVVFEMTYVGDVSYVTNFVSAKPEIPRYDVEGEECSYVAEVYIIIYCRSAGIKANASRNDRFKLFLLAGK